MYVQLGRDPEVDTEHTGGALYPIWDPCTAYFPNDE